MHSTASAAAFFRPSLQHPPCSQPKPTKPNTRLQPPPPFPSKSLCSINEPSSPTIKTQRETTTTTTTINHKKKQQDQTHVLVGGVCLVVSCMYRVFEGLNTRHTDRPGGAPCTSGPPAHLAVMAIVPCILPIIITLACTDRYAAGRHQPSRPYNTRVGRRLSLLVGGSSNAIFLSCLLSVNIKTLERPAPPSWPHEG